MRIRRWKGKKKLRRGRGRTLTYSLRKEENKEIRQEKISNYIVYLNIMNKHTGRYM